MTEQNSVSEGGQHNGMQKLLSHEQTPPSHTTTKWTSLLQIYFAWFYMLSPDAEILLDKKKKMGDFLWRVVRIERGGRNTSHIAIDGVWGVAERKCFSLHGSFHISYVVWLDQRVEISKPQHKRRTK